MKRAFMKNRLAAVLAVAVLFSVCAWAQSGSVADAAQQNQKKKASHVIDDDNLSSAVANGGDVQNASATSTATPDTDTKDPKDNNQGIVRDQKAATPQGEVDRQKAKEKSWLDTIDKCKEHLAKAETDTQREIWTENLAAAEDGLSKTRKELASAEQDAENAEQNQGSQPAAPASGETGNPPEQTGTAPK